MLPGSGLRARVPALGLAGFQEQQSRGGVDIFCALLCSWSLPGWHWRAMPVLRDFLHTPNIC